MKIYTYYQDINFSAQQELINLWKISWSRQGYEPIVLNLQDAKKHSYFETLNSEMSRISNKITNKEINGYGMSCWFRWLAYATQADEKFYVSDYDAINVNFPITEPSDQLHLMDGECPFLASGKPMQFENLCKAFVNISNERIDILKQQADHYHDQEFFEFNRVALTRSLDVTLSRDRDFIGCMYDPVKESLVQRPHIPIKNHQVCHISSQNAFEIKSQYSQYKNHDRHKLRLMLVKDLLEIT
jgi:hypothetical protein